MRYQPQTVSFWMKRLCKASLNRTDLVFDSFSVHTAATQSLNSYLSMTVTFLTYRRVTYAGAASFLTYMHLTFLLEHDGRIPIMQLSHFGL